MEKFKIYIQFYKQGEMKYFSQLDFVRILERAVRRTQLPYYLTKGYNPHVKLSFGDALKVGIEGVFSVVFYFSEKVDKDFFVNMLKKQLPSDLLFLENKYINPD